MQEITSAVIEKVSDTPVTVKIRAGWDSNNIVAIQAGEILEKIGVSAITLHARTTKQGFSGVSDWTIIKELKKTVSIPVIGNGDVNNCLDYAKMIKETNCDAVMIGRGALGNPWIFKNIINSIYKNLPISEITIDQVIDTCIDHIDLLKDNKNDIACINLSKKHINFYIKGFKDSSFWRKKLMNEHSIENIKDILKNMKLKFKKSIYLIPCR